MMRNQVPLDARRVAREGAVAVAAPPAGDGAVLKAAARECEWSHLVVGWFAGGKAWVHRSAEKRQ